MNKPVWRLLQIASYRPTPVVFREWPDGRQESCLITVIKTDLAEGVTLLDAEGVEMTPEQVQALLETLP
jgi:hypothetical protein